MKRLAAMEADFISVIAYPDMVVVHCKATHRTRCHSGVV